MRGSLLAILAALSERNELIVTIDELVDILNENCRVLNDESSTWLWFTAFRLTSSFSNSVVLAASKFLIARDSSLLPILENFIDYISENRLTFETKDCFESLKNHSFDRWHFRMLNDSVRNKCYFDAIKYVLSCFPLGSCSVVDIGGGMGLLSIYAALCGAKHVYCCESSSSLANLAKKCVDLCGLSCKITVICCHSYELYPESNSKYGFVEPADLLVTELVDAGFVGEHIIPVVNDAKARLVKPWSIVQSKQVDRLNSGLVSNIIPHRGCIYGCLIESSSLFNINRYSLFKQVVREPVSPHQGKKVDFFSQPMSFQSRNIRYSCDDVCCYEYSELSRNCVIDDICFGSNEIAESQMCEIDIAFNGVGTVQLLMLSFDLYLLPPSTPSDVYCNSIISTKPSKCSSKCAWQQAIFPVQCLQTNNSTRDSMPNDFYMGFQVAQGSKGLLSVFRDEDCYLFKVAVEPSLKSDQNEDNLIQDMSSEYSCQSVNSWLCNLTSHVVEICHHPSQSLLSNFSISQKQQSRFRSWTIILCGVNVVVDDDNDDDCDDNDSISMDILDEIRDNFNLGFPDPFIVRIQGSFLNSFDLSYLSRLPGKISLVFHPFEVERLQLPLQFIPHMAILRDYFQLSTLFSSSSCTLSDASITSFVVSSPALWSCPSINSVPSSSNKLTIFCQVFSWKTLWDHYCLSSSFTAFGCAELVAMSSTLASLINKFRSFSIPTVALPPPNSNGIDDTSYVPLSPIIQVDSISFDELIDRYDPSKGASISLWSREIDCFIERSGDCHGILYWMEVFDATTDCSITTSDLISPVFHGTAHPSAELAPQVTSKIIGNKISIHFELNSSLGLGCLPLWE